MEEKDSNSQPEEHLQKWRNPLRNRIFVISIIAGIIFTAFIFYSCRTGDCQVIYDIMKELKPGMSRKEVLSIIKKHDKPYIHKSSNQMNDETISLWVYYFAFIKSCHLIIGFHDNNLYMAKIRGEDGPHEIFKNAPPDIINEEQLK